MSGGASGARAARAVLVRICASGGAAAWACVADAQQAVEQLTRGPELIGGASIGRAILAFLVTAGLAVAAAVVLKRVLPRFGNALAPGRELRVIDRATVGAGVRVHVLQFKNQQVLLAEGRTGIALIALGDQRESGSGPQ
jgi:flagellar biogenesis protein FliO